MSMKNKVWIIFAISLLAVGLLIFAGAMIALDFDFTKLSTEKYETNTYEISIGIDDTAKIAVYCLFRVFALWFCMMWLAISVIRSSAIYSSPTSMASVIVESFSSYAPFIVVILNLFRCSSVFCCRCHCFKK